MIRRERGYVAGWRPCEQASARSSRGFAGDFVTGPATISFFAENEHSETSYRSDPGGQYNPGPEEFGAGSPAVGLERNGIFFH